MLEFVTLDRDVVKIKDYLLKSKTETCDLTLGVKYLWGESANSQYSIYNDTLILKEEYVKGQPQFNYPTGKDEGGAFSVIENYCLSNNIPLIFSPLSQAQADYLQQKYPLSEVGFNRTWSDYIYTAEQFKTYAGKSLAGQRNHVNRFKRENPNYLFKVMTESDIERVKEFAILQSKEKEKGSYTEQEERRVLPDFIDRMFDLGCFGGYLEVDGKIVAISIGEIKQDTLVVHIEKALYEFNGAYPTMAQEFAKAFADEGILYINRQDDCGDIGLRTSKMQYKPIELKNKYYVKVKTLFDSIKSPICLTADGLTIEDIKESDKVDYKRLYTDELLNRYWGYDYKTDLKDKEPTEEYFYSFQQSLKDKKEEYSLAVRKEGKMIGEIVLWNFDYYGGVETGFRFFKEEQGKGYATKSVSRVIEYLREIGVKKIKDRCHKVNTPSFNLITRLGFTKTREDDTHYYFEME